MKRDAPFGPGLGLKPLVALAVWLAATAHGQQAPPGWRAFTSAASGYKAYYPPRWTLLFPERPNMEIVNFPPSNRVKAVVLPPGGALISIIGPPNGNVKTIAQWIEYDRAAGVQSQTAILLTRRGEEPIRVVEIVQQPIEGEETVACYFDLAGHPLSADVVYWKGDPKKTEYVELLHEIIKNITSL